jgi:hypothetical protein
MIVIDMFCFVLFLVLFSHFDPSGYVRVHPGDMCPFLQMPSKSIANSSNGKNQSKRRDNSSARGFKKNITN